MNRASVVISGLGTVGACGTGTAALATALMEGHASSSEIDRSSGFHAVGGARRAALVPREAIAGRLAPLASRRMSPPSRFSVIAAELALAEARFPEPAETDPGFGFAVATAFGPASYTQRLLDQILDEGPQAASPAVFTECVANAPMAQAGIRFRAGGASYALCGREAGPLAAVARGASEVARGRIALCLAGAVEELTPLLHGILDRFRALARPDARGDERGRPFDRRRNGVLAAEGATLVALEAAEAAAARGARALARVLAWGGAFDPSAPAASWGTGAEGLARGLRAVLARADLAPQDVDLVVSGASGSVAGDRLEARVLSETWRGERLPPIVAPKSVTGEYGGAHLAAALLLLDGVALGRDEEFEEDPELGLSPRTGPSGDPRVVLVSGLACGGAASWLVLARA